MHALGLEFGSAAQLSKRPGSVWNCLWGHALKRSHGIIRKSRVSYPGPGFLSSSTWPSLPKKHYNGLNQTKFCVTNQKFRMTWLIVLLIGTPKARANSFWICSLVDKLLKFIRYLRKKVSINYFSYF